MSLVNDWSVRIAEEIAPDEVELAPILADAFMAGGKERKELFAKGGSTVGGFGSGAMAIVLPYILQALWMLGQPLFTILASDSITKFFECVTNAIKLLQTVKEQKAKIAQPLIPSENLYAPLHEIIKVMGKELKTAGLNKDQADLVTFRVLKLMLEQPQQATLFVQQLTRSGAKK